MKHVHIFLMAAITLLSLSVEAQGVQEFYQTCNSIPLNAPFKKHTTTLFKDTEPYSLRSGSYLLACPAKKLYGLPIEKALLVVYEDTVQAITIFLPFDSTLPERMEKDVGPSTGAWMAAPPEGGDTTGMIRNRRWLLDKFVVVFSCTRYVWLMGENNKDDRIIISVSRRRID